MNKIIIKCPAGCHGTGRIKILRQRCDTCKGAGTITLTKYLKLLGEHARLKNVLEYERYLTEELPATEQNEIQSSN